MAVYIYIWKSTQDEQYAHYSFSPEDGVVGVMRIAIKTGNMDLITPCPGDETNTYYQCACKAVWNGWAVGKLPQTTQYIYG
ncbi:MAG: hypothetical protein KF696_05380 [Planctomycetes bacterium]|nr:hypothetical protein [Planctomycetota bacterium]MCW8136318.1 hypothetical protein [Planctomycetota bacterium]